MHPLLLDGIAAGIGLIGLVLLVKLPWDLYMEARGLIADQRDARKRDIAVDPEEERYAKRAARRLLAVCIGLHVVTAAVVGAATWASGGSLGYFFAGFYLLSTFFRPAVALYRHLVRRLRELRGRTRYPREDVVTLVARVRDLERELEERGEASKETRCAFEASLDRLGQRVDALDREHRVRVAAFEDQVALVLRELERTVDRLTEDRELLAGIRAFVKVVKEA